MALKKPPKGGPEQAENGLKGPKKAPKNQYRPKGPKTGFRGPM